jgi:hypothetical protein
LPGTREDVAEIDFILNVYDDDSIPIPGAEMIPCTKYLILRDRLPDADEETEPPSQIEAL